MIEAAPSRCAVLAALCLLTATGGALDAWVFLSHGHVFANAQSGNVVLIGIKVAAGDWTGAGRHLPSLGAYLAGLFGSRLLASQLKSRGVNSRSVRLAMECALLIGLAGVADRWPDSVVTASVGFLAALQITSLSHLGPWSFNTGMTTGNLRSAAVALVATLDGDERQWPHAFLMVALCLAFALGAVLGGWLAPRMGGAALLVAALLVGSAAILCRHAADPLPAWSDL